MQSEQQPIDDFFRSKEKEWVPGNNRQEAHWQQMQKQLASPAVPPAKGGHIPATHRLLYYMAGLAIITVVAIFIINAVSGNKQAPGLSTIPAAELPDKTVTQKNNTITVEPKKPESTATTRKPKSKTAGQKNVPPVTKNKKSVPVKNATPDLPVRKKNTAVQPAVSRQQPDAAAILQAFYARLEKKGQTFLIHPGRDTILVAQEGTRLIIPARTFITKSGNRPPGTIRIVMKEYYSYEDILAAKLSTTSNDQLLVTGGMIHLAAESDGKEVIVAPGKSIAVEMPTDNYDERMQLFTGSEPLQKLPVFTETYAQKTDRDTVPIQKPEFTFSKTIHDSVPVQKYDLTYKNTDHDSVSLKKFNFSNKKTKRDSVQIQKFDNFYKKPVGDSATHVFVDGDQQKLLTYTGINWQPAGQEQWLPSRSLVRTVKVPDITGEPYKVHYGKKGITARFLISADLKQSNQFVKERLKRYSHFYDKIKVRRLLFGSKPLRLFSNKEIPVIKDDSIPMSFNSALRLRLISSEDSARYMDRLIQDSLYTENQKKYLKNYRFTITTLGWYNCDRFLRENRPLVDFALNLGEGYEAGNFISQLVFTRFPSVADGYYSGSKFLFRQLPENEKVQLVCVGVKDGKVVSCFRDLIISKEEFNHLQFEETTPEAFRQKLASLKTISTELN